MQAQTLLNTPAITTLKGLRDRAVIAALLACGLRGSQSRLQAGLRPELAAPQGQSGKENRYILTIPGRGYQFAAPLESEPLQMVMHAAHTQTTAIVEEEYFDGLAENAPGKPLEKLPAAKSRSRRWIWAGAAALAAIACAGAMVYRAAQRPVPGGHREIVVADFVNHGKDPAFDLTLRRAVEIELGQSPYLSILPQPRVAETLRMMGRQADENLSEPIAREVCRRNGGQAFITGEIASVEPSGCCTVDLWTRDSPSGTSGRLPEPSCTRRHRSPT